jgi:glycosyltransferase involved in cell wall biosynthesis
VSTPDVSVVVTVHNAMPELTRCLNSLVRQSIGRHRMEIIAVDDGSTDTSGRELDWFAKLYPETVRVIRQPYSGGGLGAPSNRALEQATGRYVFFVRATDYLGREALERLVTTADAYGSDVVLGRVVGLDGRHIDQSVFAGNETRVGLFDSALPWSLSNTKLFRRSLIERYRLRFPEDLVVAGDQPFTFEACLRAGRISVLADYEFYYATRRTREVHRAGHLDRLRSVETIMHLVARLVGPGKDRDHVLRRHFSWEVARLVEDDFLRLARPVQEQVVAGIRDLADLYLTDQLRSQLEIEARLRISTAQRGTVEDVIAVIRQDAEQGVPPTIIDGDRWYAGYPGFRDPRLNMPDEWFEVSGSAADWLARLEAIVATWGTCPDGERALTVIARTPRRDLVALASGPIGLTAGDVVGTTLETTRDKGGTTLRVQFRLGPLLDGIPPGGRLYPVRSQLTAFGTVGSAPLRAPIRPPVSRLMVRRGARFYVVTPTVNHRGQFVIAMTPVTPRRIIQRLRRKRP